jgi:choline dehydrogenase-like flavoprotein
MLVALDSLETGGDRPCDLAIVGGGAAGLGLALGLAGSGLEIVLAEAGEEAFDPWHQSFCAGSSIGDLSLDPETTRLRQLGGSTNHWGGRSRPLDAEALAARPWLGLPAWPLEAGELRRHLAAACRLLEIDRPPDEPWDAPADSDAAAQALGGPTLTPAVWRFSPPTRMGERWRTELAARADLTLLLDADLVDIELAPSLDRIQWLDLRSRPGKTLRLRPKVTVLAMGGIENARLLLACRRQLAAGIGNRHDQVGRHFMGHPIFEPLQLSLAEGARLPELLHDRDTPAHGHIEGLLHLNRAGQEALEATAVDAAFYSDGQFGPPGFRAARRLQRKLGHGQLDASLIRDGGEMLGDLPGLVHESLVKLGWLAPEAGRLTVSTLIEQCPDPASRITLDQAVDAFGRPRARVDWRLGEADRQTVRRFARHLADHVAARGLGRPLLAPWVTDETLPFPPHGNSAHHMGATRMSHSPRTGVVDPDCRVHGMTDLYIAGSSVFPTSGSQHPTLNLVMLTLRLAEHLTRRLGHA